MHTETKTNTETPQKMGSTLNNRSTTTKPKRKPNVIKEWVITWSLSDSLYG